MRKDKEIAIDLRKNGKSYKEIRESLKIPKSTLSEWFSGEEWSKDIRKKLTAAAKIESTIRIVELDKIRGQHLSRLYEEARKEAQQELETLKYNPLFIAGMMLYWGEGDKISKNVVRLTNTDADLLQLYLTFLTTACRIPITKIKGHVLVYPDMDERICKAYWSKKVGLPQENFTKSTQILGRHKTRRLTWGICIILVSSSYFKVKILEWLKLFPKELMEKRYYETI